MPPQVNPQTGRPTSSPAGGYTQPGAAGAAYDPTSVAGTIAAGSGQDIWGLDPTEQMTPINVGYLPPPTVATTRGAPGFYQANLSPGQAPPTLTPSPVGTPNAYGIQTKTMSELMADLAAMSENDKQSYIALQQALYQAGFYGSMPKESLAVGIFDQATQAAYMAAMQRTAQLSGSGKTLAEVIAQKNPVIAERDKTAVKPGFMAIYSDPQTVAAIAQASAQATLGRNLTTAEVKAFTDEFHTQEQRWNTSQKTALAQQAAGQDVTSPNQPDAKLQADVFAKRGSRGVEATGNRLADYVGVLQGLIGTGG